MSEDEIRINLEESLKDVEGKPVNLKTDFRELRALFVCTAGENTFLCSRFKPSIIGSCTFRSEYTTCAWSQEGYDERTH